MLIATCRFDSLKWRLLMPSSVAIRYTYSELKLTGSSTEIRFGLKSGVCFFNIYIYIIGYTEDILERKGLMLSLESRCRSCHALEQWLSLLSRKIEFHLGWLEKMNQLKKEVAWSSLKAFLFFLIHRDNRARWVLGQTTIINEEKSG